MNASGQLDLPALDTQLDFLLSTGITGIMALGSTGRFPNLGLPVREQLLAHVMKRSKGLPVIANVSDIDMAAVEQLARKAAELGAAGVSVLPPWYYEVSQSDLIEWFARVGETSGLPVWLYNFPERTGNRIELNTVKEVMRRTTVGGFKQSGADQEFLRELAGLTTSQQNFHVFAGADDQIAESLERGAVGCISGLANALPDVMVRVFDAACSGNRDSVVNDQQLLTSVSRRLHLIPFPWNQAAVMEARGIPVGVLPDTLSRVSLAHYAQLCKETETMMLDHGLARLS